MEISIGCLCEMYFKLYRWSSNQWLLQKKSEIMEQELLFD